MHQRAITLALVSLGVAVALALALPAVADATRWRAPTDGRVTRAFSFDAHDAFAPGRHRGADFAAARGAPVHAPCRGRVVVARRIGTSGGVVTIACGGYRVSVLPLERITQFGARVRAGALVGAAGRSRAHDGVHLGVRRAGDRFGYVDPLPFLGAPTRLPPVAPFTRPRPARPPRSAPSRLRSAAHHLEEARVPAARALATAFSPPALPLATAYSPPARALAPASPAAARTAATSRPLAPWPAWVALGALLIAAAGSGVRWRGRGVRTRPCVGARRGALARVAPARDDLPP